MNCDDAHARLNRRLDGSLEVDDAAALDAHLAGCAACQATVEALAAVDTELREAFDERRAAAARLAERTSALLAFALPAERVVSAGVVPTISPARATLWSQWLVAAAAGFLLAVVVFRPWQSSSQEPLPMVDSQPPQDAPSGEKIARVDVASGNVDVWMASQLAMFSCPSSTEIESDSIVRTGPTIQCELSLGPSCTLRLDCNTEVKLHTPDVVEVKQGRLWSCTQPGGEPLEVKLVGGTVVAQPAAEFAVACEPDVARVAVVNGEVCVATGDDTLAVRAGKQVEISAGAVQEVSEHYDPLLETAWVNQLLVLRGPEHPELVERVNQLLASIGAAKLSLLYEDELRSLGHSGVPPLLAYLGATRETPRLDQREVAARIVADLAQPVSIGDLIALLIDSNPHVRYEAARGLVRLTGRDLGCDPNQWRSDSWDNLKETYRRWILWWAACCDRHPGARRDLSMPQSPPF